MSQAAGRRFLGNSIRLARRSWEDVAPELEFLLDRIWKSEAGGLPAGFNHVTPEAVEAGDAGSPGNETSGWAAADHTHAVTTGEPVGLANTNVEGSSGAVPRLDHQHKRDVRVKLNGVDLATRNAINFIDSLHLSWFGADDAGADEAVVSALVLPHDWVAAITVADSPYTPAAEDAVILGDATGGVVTVSLPAASAQSGRRLSVKKIDASANKVTVVAAGGDLIDGAATEDLLAQYDAVTIVSDGVSAWYIF